MKKGIGSGSIGQRCGSADPDPHQNVTNPDSTYQYEDDDTREVLSGAGLIVPQGPILDTKGTVSRNRRLEERRFGI